MANAQSDYSTPQPMDIGEMQCYDEDVNVEAVEGPAFGTCWTCGGSHFARSSPKGNSEGQKGFGKGEDKGKGKGKMTSFVSGSCWTCGGNHFSREFPKGDGGGVKGGGKNNGKAMQCFYCGVWNERGDTVVVTVDTDHAGCSETRRSTSSAVIQVNGHVLSEWSNTHSTIALSTGESEFVAIVKGVVMGRFTKNLLNELGWCITLVVCRSDSSARLGMASRLGVGRRSKHLETKSLFAQHLVKDGSMVLKLVHTKVSTADIGTKYLDAHTMRKLIGLLGRQIADAGRC